MQHSMQGSHSILSQTKNNTTLWIGHLENDTNDHFAGQTFVCPESGLVNNIQVFSTSVHLPGDISLTLHEFDEQNKNWGPVISTGSIHLEKGEEERWISFKLPAVQLEKNKTYGFRLQTPNAMIGLGEAASPSKHPFTFGNEWNADSKNHNGHYYSYFSLAFKIEMCA